MHGARPGGALRLLELGKARQQFILLSDHCHSCWSLHILSWGTQLGFVLSLITFGSQWNTLESACHCQHFVLPQDLEETEAAGMWLEAYQLTGGRGSWSAGISIPAAPRRSWIRFPMQRLSGNLYVPGYLHGKVSTLLSRQAFHQQCGGRQPTTFRRQLKQSPNPGSEGRMPKSGELLLCPFHAAMVRKDPYWAVISSCSSGG